MMAPTEVGDLRASVSGECSQAALSMADFECEKVLGRGSYGTAMLVTEKREGNRRVIKEINLATMPKKAQREAQMEAGFLRSLSHVNITAYYDAFVEGTKLCIVMEYADNGDLSKAVKEKKAEGSFFDQAQSLVIFTQCVLALRLIHSRHVLHRDLKCQNIFLMKNGVVKLGDFGIAKLLDNTCAQAVTVIGTPSYLSPEVINNTPYGIKADIWALGIVLYELLALEAPFQGTNLAALVVKIVTSDPKPVSSENYNEDVRSLVTTLLQKDPVLRPNAQEVLSTPVVSQSLSLLPPEVAATVVSVSSSTRPSASEMPSSPLPGSATSASGAASAPNRIPRPNTGFTEMQAAHKPSGSPGRVPERKVEASGGGSSDTACDAEAAHHRKSKRKVSLGSRAGPSGGSCSRLRVPSSGSLPDPGPPPSTRPPETAGCVALVSEGADRESLDQDRRVWRMPSPRSPSPVGRGRSCEARQSSESNKVAAQTPARDGMLSCRQELPVLLNCQGSSRGPCSGDSRRGSKNLCSVPGEEKSSNLPVGLGPKHSPACTKTKSLDNDVCRASPPAQRAASLGGGVRSGRNGRKPSRSVGRRRPWVGPMDEVDARVEPVQTPQTTPQQRRWEVNPNCGAFCQASDAVDELLQGLDAPLRQADPERPGHMKSFYDVGDFVFMGGMGAQQEPVDRRFCREGSERPNGRDLKAPGARASAERAAETRVRPEVREYLRNKEMAAKNKMRNEGSYSKQTPVFQRGPDRHRSQPAERRHGRCLTAESSGPDGVDGSCIEAIAKEEERRSKEEERRAVLQEASRQAKRDRQAIAQRMQCGSSSEDGCSVGGVLVHIHEPPVGEAEVSCAHLRRVSRQEKDDPCKETQKNLPQVDQVSEPRLVRSQPSTSVVGSSPTALSGSDCRQFRSDLNLTRSSFHSAPEVLGRSHASHCLADHCAPLTRSSADKSRHGAGHSSTIGVAAGLVLGGTTRPHSGPSASHEASFALGMSQTHLQKQASDIGISFQRSHVEETAKSDLLKFREQEMNGVAEVLRLQEQTRTPSASSSAPPTSSSPSHDSIGQRQGERRSSDMAVQCTSARVVQLSGQEATLKVSRSAAPDLTRRFGGALLSLVGGEGPSSEQVADIPLRSSSPRETEKSERDATRCAEDVTTCGAQPLARAGRVQQVAGSGQDDVDVTLMPCMVGSMGGSATDVDCTLLPDMDARGGSSPTDKIQMPPLRGASLSAAPPKLPPPAPPHVTEGASLQKPGFTPSPMHDATPLGQSAEEVLIAQLPKENSRSPPGLDPGGHEPSVADSVLDASSPSYCFSLSQNSWLGSKKSLNIADALTTSSVIFGSGDIRHASKVVTGDAPCQPLGDIEESKPSIVSGLRRRSPRSFVGTSLTNASLDYSMTASM